MKALLILFLITAVFTGFAQDTSISKKPSAHLTEDDRMSLLRMNHTSNMMLGGGIGLCGVGGFLVYYGVTTYNAGPLPNSTNPNGDIRLNHNQGIGFFAGAAVAFAGGAALITLGAMRKYQFKLRKKTLNMHAGLTPNGNILLALDF